MSKFYNSFSPCGTLKIYWKVNQMHECELRIGKSMVLWDNDFAVCKRKPNLQTWLLTNLFPEIIKIVGKVVMRVQALQSVYGCLLENRRPANIHTPAQIANQIDSTINHHWMSRQARNQLARPLWSIKYIYKIIHRLVCNPAFSFFFNSFFFFFVFVSYRYRAACIRTHLKKFLKNKISL